ncbi:MAG: hypothetical protein KIS78_18115 [Labilithrix sp.]|nr:hypothetical protein [Labilithrix sp.]
MRRTALSRVFLLSFTAVTFALGACATAPTDDDLSGLTQEQNPASPEDEPASAKLPAASNPSQNDDTTTDAGKDADAPKDAGTKDATPPAPDAGPPPTGGDDCDPNDPLNIIKLMLVSNPTPCPCSASECCLAAASLCLPK